MYWKVTVYDRRSGGQYSFIIERVRRPYFFAGDKWIVTNKIKEGVICKSNYFNFVEKNKDLGRHKQLSVGDVGTPNEMLFITESDIKDSRKITDLICIHNYDYDGYLTLEKLQLLLSFFKLKNK